MARGSPVAMEDIVATDELTVTLLLQALQVARISPGALQGCTWPLLKSMFGTADEGDYYLPRGFFSLTQEEDELTLVLDERCRAAFDEASSIARVEYAPHQWYAFELHLGSLAWEVPGLVCHLATLMAESDISILNLSSHDRDFLLVQQSDVDAAKEVIQKRLQVRPRDLSSPRRTPRPTPRQMKARYRSGLTQTGS